MGQYLNDDAPGSVWLPEPPLPSEGNAMHNRLLVVTVVVLALYGLISLAVTLLGLL